MFFSCETKPQGQVKEMVNLERPGITPGGFRCMKHLGGFTVKSPESNLARHWSYVAQPTASRMKYATDLSPLFLLMVALRTRYITYITHLQRLLRLDEVST